MVSNGVRRSSSHVAVSFGPGIRADRLLRCEVRTGVGNHELVVLDFRRRIGDVAVPDGTQVTVRYGSSRLWTKTAYGYVNHAERIDTGDPSNTNNYRVYCVGAAKPMNAPNPRRWDNVTGSYIARSVAQRYAFRAVVSKSTSRIEWVQPRDESDFAMMNRLADACGRLFWPSGTTLNFVDPAARIVNAANGNVQTFVRTYPALRNPTDTLREMRLIRGGDAPGHAGSSVTQAYGIDPISGRLIKATATVAYKSAGLSAPSIGTIYPGVVQSGAEGADVTSRGIYTGTWSTLQADVWIQGAPVYVGNVVNLAGSGVASSEQGLWFVSGLTEVMVFRGDEFGYDYSANLTLTRNNNDVHVVRSTKNMTGSTPMVPAIWVGNRWQSQILGDVYV